MPRRSALAVEEAVSFEKTVVLDYVRLCFSEGVPPSEAFKEATRKLRQFNELKHT
ncbi:MAG: hypothetical protein NWF05_00115 [Candidatus Bathyarchaeota archaeon]|nr:hypothetical protein [Candidatus Bathyarchaeota archaeon]